MDIIQAVSRACVLASRIPHLNNGGCCVFAAELGTRLEQEGVDAWGLWAADVAWSEAMPSPACVRPLVHDTNSLEEWVRFGLEPNHVVLRFKHKGHVFQADSYGITPPHALLRYRYEIKNGKFSIEELRAFASDPAGWNRAFNRARGIPAITQAIQQAFS